MKLPSLNLDIDLDDGIWVIVALVALVAGILGAGIYLIYAAPAILPEAAFNAMLASSFTRAAKKAQVEGWAQGVFRSTWIPLVLVLLLTIGLAFTVHHVCPGAPKLMDALSCPGEVQR